VKVAIMKSADATWSQGYYPASDFVLLGYPCTYGDLAQADGLIEDAGLANEYDSTFPAENIPKVVAVLRMNGYEVTLPANWPLPQDDAPHTE